MLEINSEGFKKQSDVFLTKLDKAVAKVEQDLIHIVMRGAMIVERAAKAKIKELGHIRTGALRGSIHVVNLLGIQSSVVQVQVGSDRNYAIWVELLPDGGYLFISFMNKRTEVEEYINNQVRKLIETVK